jgi:ParB family chromosome partitioning protein
MEVIKMEYRKINIDEIELCPFIKYREDVGDLTSMVKSIKIKGDVEQALKVTPNPKGKFWLVWGKRRLEACKLLGLKQVTCMVEVMNEDEMFRQSAIENMYRKDMNDMEWAEYFEAWSRRCGLSYKEIGAEIGDVDFVYHRTRLLELPIPIRNKIRTGANFTLRHGHLLLQIKDPSLQEKLADEIVEKGLTARELEKKIKEIGQPSEVKEEHKEELAPPKEVEKEPTKPIEVKAEAEEIVKSAIKHGMTVKPYEDLLKEVEELRGRLEEVEYFLQSIAGEYNDVCPYCHKTVYVKVNPNFDKKALKVNLVMFKEWNK